MTGKVPQAVLAAVLTFGAAAAVADTVYLNTAAYGQPQILASVAGAKFRLDGTNWDMALHSGTGTNAPQPGPAADFVQANLTNSLNTVTYQFTLTHQAGIGFTYSMTNGSSGQTLAWGSGLGGTNVGTLQRQTGSGLDGINHSPTDSFNFLLLEARAQRNDGNPNNEPDSQLSFSNLMFNGVGLSTSGSLVSGTTTENTPGSAWTPPGQGVETGRYWQFLYSDVDLSQYDWTFSADVTAMATTNSGQESLRFELTAKNVTPVPLPAGAWLLLSGLTGLAALRRKQAGPRRQAGLAPG
jgi:hypothetical protein